MLILILIIIIIKNTYTYTIGVRKGYAGYAAAYPERTQSLTHTN